MENNQHAAPKDESASSEHALTVDQIIAELACFTAEQRSLAWSPEPPFTSTGGFDCRVGGSGGLEFTREHPHARWVQARYRWKKEARG